MADLDLLGVPYVNAAQLYTATTLLPLVGLGLVAIRLRRRMRSKAGFGVDDWFLVTATGLNICGAICLLIGLEEGAFGYPSPDLQGLNDDERFVHVDPTRVQTGKLQLAHLVLVGLAYGFLKLSIIFFYRRIFVTQNGSTFDWVCRGCAAMSVVWMFGVIISLLLQCGSNLNAAFGSLADESKYCQSFMSVETGYVISDLITNIIIWLLPVPMIWGLQMPLSKKVSLFGLFAVSSLSIIACIIKLAASIRFAQHGYDPEIDWELTLSTTLYWCTVEGGVAIIATCLPDMYYYVDLFIKGETMTSLRSKLPLLSGLSHDSHNSSGSGSGRRSVGLRSPMLPKHGPAMASPGLATPHQCPMHDSKNSPCMCYSERKGGAHVHEMHPRDEATESLRPAYYELESEKNPAELDAAKNPQELDVEDNQIVVTQHYSVGSDYA